MTLSDMAIMALPLSLTWDCLGPDRLVLKPRCISARPEGVSGSFVYPYQQLQQTTATQQKGEMLWNATHNERAGMQDATDLSMFLIHEAIVKSTQAQMETWYR